MMTRNVRVPRLSYSLLLLLMLLVCVVPSFAQKSLLLAGKGAGSVELGNDYTRTAAALGAPSKVEPTQADPNTKLYFHKDVLLLVGTENKIIGITITSPAYRTPDGLGVGSSEREVMRKLGQGLVRGTGNRSYANRGIGFSFDAAGKASQVYIFKPEGDRPLLGDRLVMAGKRAGELRLGMKFSAIEQAWGPAPSSRNMGGGSQLVGYPSNSVRFVVHAGVVDGILIGTGDFITPQGLKVGATAKGVQQVLGQCMHKKKNGLFYPKLGIGFMLESNQVTEIQILYPR